MTKEEREKAMDEWERMELLAAQEGWPSTARKVAIGIFPDDADRLFQPDGR